MTELLWHLYSKKIQKRMRNRYHAGIILKDQTRPPEMRWVMGEASHNSIWCKIYLIIDETDGIIVDSKFQTFSPPIVIGLLETLCSLIMRKNHSQAGHITAEFIEEYLRDSPSSVAFPKRETIYLPMILTALQSALSQCSDIELSLENIPSPISTTVDSGESHPEFLQYTHLQKQNAIETVLEKEISPFIALDEGAVHIISIEGSCITIRYSGSCVSCYSATGSTLHAIQSILRQRVHPSIQVVPDLTPTPETAK